MRAGAHSITSSARGEHGRRHGQPERLGGLEINHQFEFGWLHDRQIRGFDAVENTTGDDMHRRDHFEDRQLGDRRQRMRPEVQGCRTGPAAIAPVRRTAGEEEMGQSRLRPNSATSAVLPKPDIFKRLEMTLSAVWDGSELTQLFPDLTSAMPLTTA